ncbi:MAG: hypothetical protein R2862_11955 [Thermoanaerobaculia bacterium]
MLAASAGQAQPTSLELLGMAEIAGDPIVDGTPAGGLSESPGSRVPGSTWRFRTTQRNGRRPGSTAWRSSRRTPPPTGRGLDAVTLRDLRGATLPERSLDPEERWR